MFPKVLISVLFLLLRLHHHRKNLVLSWLLLDDFLQFVFPINKKFFIIIINSFKKLTTILIFGCDPVLVNGKSSAILDSCGFVAVELLLLLLLLLFNGDLREGIGILGDAS